MDYKLIVVTGHEGLELKLGLICPERAVCRISWQKFAYICQNKPIDQIEQMLCALEHLCSGDPFGALDDLFPLQIKELSQRDDFTFEHMFRMFVWETEDFDAEENAPILPSYVSGAILARELMRADIDSYIVCKTHYWIMTEHISIYLVPITSKNETIGYVVNAQYGDTTIKTTFDYPQQAVAHIKQIKIHEHLNPEELLCLIRSNFN